MPIIPAWAVGTLSEATWRDKIVILGSTAPSLGDQLETPFGQQSGSEVLLSAISGLQHGRGFRSPDPMQLAAVVAIWLLLCHWRIARPATALGTAINTVVLELLAIALTVFAWFSGLWLPGAAFMLMPLVAGFAQPEVGRQIDHANTLLNQCRHLAHGDVVGRCEKYQIAG